MWTSGCGKAVKLLKSLAKAYIVFHWDTDGIASAAMLSRTLGMRVIGLSVPSIGFYSVDAINYKGVNADAIVVLDYGVEGYEEVETETGIPLIVFDHHAVRPSNLKLGAYCNPVARGEGDEQEYPSTTMLLYRLLGGDKKLAALGAIGDLAPQIDAGRSVPSLERLEIGVDTVKALRKAVDVLDSCYRLLDVECIKYAVALLAAYGVKPVAYDSILRVSFEKSKTIVAEAERRLKQVSSDDYVEVYSLELDAYVTSSLGRSLAVRSPKKVIALAHYMPSQDRGFIYARSVLKRLEAAREKLRRLGLKVGGKSYVLVVEVQGDPSTILGTVVKALREAAVKR